MRAVGCDIGWPKPSNPLMWLRRRLHGDLS
jgi:hypothetical protein